MASRGRPTVDPAKVTTIDEWLKYYKLRYGNIVMRNGELLVLDPGLARSDPKAALEDPVKTIPLKKGYDTTIVLGTTDAGALRAAAEDKREGIIAQRDIASAEALAAFTALESQYLEAVDAWEAAEAGSRIGAALAVGELSRQLAAADRRYRTALYPRRYIFVEEDLSRKQLNWASHDDRAADIVYRIVPETTTAADRTIEADRA